MVVWLGGHALEWADTFEFNLKQDVLASRLIFDFVVPLVIFLCWGLSSSLTLEQTKVDTYIRGKGVYGQHLAVLYPNLKSDPDELPNIIWDLAQFARMINENWAETKLVSSSLMTDRLVHKAQQFHLEGESQRKLRSQRSMSHT